MAHTKMAVRVGGTWRGKRSGAALRVRARSWVRHRHGVVGRRRRLGVPSHPGLRRRAWSLVRGGARGGSRGHGGRRRGCHPRDVRGDAGPQRTSAPRRESGAGRGSVHGVDDHRRGTIRYDRDSAPDGESASSLVPPSPRTNVMAPRERYCAGREVAAAMAGAACRERWASQQAGA